MKNSNLIKSIGKFLVNSINIWFKFIFVYWDKNTADIISNWRISIEFFIKTSFCLILVDIILPE